MKFATASLFAFAGCAVAVPLGPIGPHPGDVSLSNIPNSALGQAVGDVVDTVEQVPVLGQIVGAIDKGVQTGAKIVGGEFGLFNDAVNARIQSEKAKADAKLAADQAESAEYVKNHPGEFTLADGTVGHVDPADQQ